VISLPSARTIDEFRLIERSDARVQTGADALWRRLDIGTGDVVLFESGSLPVFGAGREHVLKLFPACHADEAEREQSVLERLDGALPVATPRVVVSGEIDGWRYLVMHRVPGAPLDRVWPSLSPEDRIGLAEQAGRLLAALHVLDARGMSVLRPAWPNFVREQSERCVETQRGRGAPAWCLEQIPGFLETAALKVNAPPVLLHTEVMREHLLAEPGPSGWSLSGIIDFEPAMMGAAEYEFAAVGLFLTKGDAPALHALLRAYGWREAGLGLDLQRRFLAYTLLHRYSNLRRYIENRPPPPGTETLDGLAVWWWALPQG
jgi:hygromycin-B 7''-O-kinase